MIQQDIINLYNKGYSKEQIVNITYRQGFDYKTGRYSLSKSEILHIFEKTILEYLKGGKLW